MCLFFIAWPTASVIERQDRHIAQMKGIKNRHEFFRSFKRISPSIGELCSVEVEKIAFLFSLLHGAGKGSKLLGLTVRFKSIKFPHHTVCIVLVMERWEICCPNLVLGSLIWCKCGFVGGGELLRERSWVGIKTSAHILWEKSFWSS